jgi:hypothetical protein
MNTLIFDHIKKKLQDVWHLDKHQQIRDSINASTVLDTLPWTPARKEKLKNSLEQAFGVPIELSGTVTDLTRRTDNLYLRWFFGEVWRPRTDKYAFSGWQLADMINRYDPKNVLDVGCGYNQFKERIPNLIGLDPYNNNADYMIDILDYRVEAGSHDHIIALGSINFNTEDEIIDRFGHCVELLAPGGRIWMRCNPGIPHVNGPWVQIFHWNFEFAHRLAKEFGLNLETLKQDQDRLFLIFNKNAT